METINQYYRVDPDKIYFIKFIFEAYDGIAMLSTVNVSTGLIILRIAPGCKNEAEMIIKDLKKAILIEPVKKENIDLEVQ